MAARFFRGKHGCLDQLGRSIGVKDALCAAHPAYLGGMQVQKFLIMGCLALASLGVGCGDDNSSDGPGMRGNMQREVYEDPYENEVITYTCGVDISPTVIDYTLDGDFLTLTPAGEPGGYTMPREGSGSGLQGSWLVSEGQTDDGLLTGRLLLVIGTDSFTARQECTATDGAHGVSELTSRANITDTSNEILDQAADEVTF
jgi:hypothetical protein